MTLLNDIKYPQHIFDKPYDFTNNNKSDIQSLVHLINFLGDDLVGLELGVSRGESFMTLLHNCPNIRTLHGIDSYKPYTDFLKEPYDGSAAYVVGYKEIDLVKSIAMNYFEFSGMREKIHMHQMDSEEALQFIDDESLDFIFIDTYMTYEQAYRDFNSWYPKLKKGGLFSGHDWTTSPIRRAVFEFREQLNIENTMSAFDNCFCWYK